MLDCFGGAAVTSMCNEKTATRVTQDIRLREPLTDFHVCGQIFHLLSFPVPQHSLFQLGKYIEEHFAVVFWHCGSLQGGTRAEQYETVLTSPCKESVQVLKTLENPLNVASVKSSASEKRV